MSLPLPFGPCCGEAAGPLVLGGTGSVGASSHALVYDGSPECGEPSTLAPPCRDRCLQVQTAAREELRKLIVSGVFRPGGGITWPIEEVDRVLAYVPGVAWYTRPLYFQSQAPGYPLAWRCNAGVSGYPLISVSLQDQSRVLPLVLWETCNLWMGFLARPDCFDLEPIPTVLAACRARGVFEGGW